MLDDELLAGIEIPIIPSVALTEAEILDIAFVGVFPVAVFIIAGLIAASALSEGAS